MVTTSERIQNCRAHADQCRAWADLTDHPSAKRSFLQAAIQWENLASEIKDIEKMRSYVQTTGKHMWPPSWTG
jgi:hypothetical protein